MRPGLYELDSTLALDTDAYVHGKRRKPARLVTDDSPVVSASFSAPRVTDLIFRSSTGGAINAGLGEAKFERVQAFATAAVAAACDLPESPGYVRNAVCVNDGGGPAVSKSVFAGSVVTFTYPLINVTAIARPPGGAPALGGSFTAGGSLTMDVPLINSVVRGSGGAADIHTERGASTSTVAVSAEGSSFATTDVGTGTSAPAPGAGTNFTAAPELVAPAQGDYRQLAGSPTVNAGISDVDPGVGRFDFEGERRRAEGAPDTGADEFTGILEVTARRTQDLDRLRIRVACPLTRCRVRAGGNGLAAATERLDAGRPERVRLRPDGAEPGDRLAIRVRAKDRTGARERETVRVRAR